jgi:hypothetical protein
MPSNTSAIFMRNPWGYRRYRERLGGAMKQ